MASYKQDKDFIAWMFPSSLLDEAISWIKSNLEPEDVFDAAQLEDWAKVNLDN